MVAYALSSVRVVCLSLGPHHRSDVVGNVRWKRTLLRVADLIENRDGLGSAS